MPVNFPDTPNIGDTFTVGTNTFEWDGVKWVVISTDGIDVSDATAEVTDVLASETFYAGEDADIKTGTIPSKTAETFTPTTTDQTITAGQYLSEDQTISGDADLTVSNIKTGVDIFGVNGTFTADATATAGDILAGQTAYVNGAEITGNIASKGSETFTPGTTNQTISSGQYLSGTQTILGDADLLPENIRENTIIFGVTGTLEEVTPPSYYLDFDGVDDYVQFNSTSSLEPSGNRTYEFIIYYDGTQGSILTQRTATGGFGLSIKSNNTLGGVNFKSLDWDVSSALLVPNQINHIVWRINSGTVTYFINGQNAGSSSTGNYNNVSTRIVLNSSLTTNNSISTYSSFDFYEVRIWTTALSDTTIANNQTRGSYNGSESNLELLYLVNEGSGTTLGDSAGNNDGTIYGATWEQE